MTTTVTVCDESPLRVTVAVRFAADSSEVDTSAIESVGVPSSSVIVTVPVATEIAELVGYVVSDKASYINGATLSINGGLWMD